LRERLQILDIWVDPVTREEACQRASHFLEFGQRPYSVFASNPEKNFSVPKDPILYEVYRNADLLLPDGIGVVMAVRILYGIKIERVPGADFIFDICRLAEREGYKIFIYGAREEVNRLACERLQSTHPRLNLVGRSNGYVKDDEMLNLVKRINESMAEILFLALGSPKQEKWFAENKDRLNYVRVCQGIGGTLDTVAGTVERAPKSWQKARSEWLYRLLADPKRIRRQKVLPIFAAKVLAAKLRSLLQNKQEA
jgi:N-acetylglucosaminyldiphosphoundecaprenol N-acetyl-beta-D-mannosaminyltransferase